MEARIRIASSTRRPVAAAIAALLLATSLLAHVGAARAEWTPDAAFSSRGKFAVYGAWQWFTRQRDDVKMQATCCLVSLEQAKVHEDQALDYRSASMKPGLSQRERSRLNALANDEFALRGDALADFRDCVNSVIHGINLQKQGADGSAFILGACGTPAGVCRLTR